jgi:DNA-binding transcriptional ArsR family regulator
MKELPETQAYVLKGFYEKSKLAKQHNMRFSVRILAEDLGMNYNTLYSHIKRLRNKGMVKIDRFDLTVKGVRCAQSIK